LGVLSILALINAFFIYYFKSNVYLIYFFYLLATIAYVAMVFIRYGEILPKSSIFYYYTKIFYEGIQTLIFYLNILFIYKSVLTEYPPFKKLNWLINMYTVFVVFQITLSLIWVLRVNPVFFVSTRLITIGISLFFYVSMARLIGIIYVRHLFIACSVLLLFSLLAFYDATVNLETSVFRGFQFICIGYVLEGLCIAGAFVYRIYSINQQSTSRELQLQKQLLTTQSEIQAQTLQHIGREIHDNVGQQLTLASLYAQQLVYDQPPSPKNEKITSISKIINQALNELRSLSKSLTNDSVKTGNIVELLEEECRKIEKLKTFQISFITNLNTLILNYQAKIVVLRVVQEFIQNSIKHSYCKNIQVALQENDNKVELTLKDDGIGFDVKKIGQGGGNGLINIKHRTELVNCVYSLQSELNKGTILRLIFPNTL
jgi:signal transduction histidine kinase